MDTFLGLFLLGSIFAIYFCPTLIALFRGKRNVWSIGILNFFLGWTFIGWLISLIWAASYESPKEATA